MSSKVDERIVNMKFNNSQFEKGVTDTAKSLEGLKKGLDLKDMGKGVTSLASAFKNFSLDGISNGVQTLASKFSALSVVGITALANIANKAVDAGLKIAKSLTIDPVKQGFDEYELKMDSIQTILANTSRYGTKLQDVTGALDELNNYADDTIYNFGDMTKNIGLFTNAGIRVEDATSMIKGFSNAAAASGTSAAGAAGAAYQLSQALSAGTIRLMDWRSLTNVGMGNKNMQNGLIEIADAMGMLNEKGISAEEIQGDFNASLEKNWLSADVMSKYLQIMAGDLSKAEQASLGLTDAQIKGFAEQQQMAQDAATKVRTYSKLMDTLGEAVGSGWSQTFDILIGNFDEATELWTGISNTLGTIIGDMADARNNLLQGWADFGGRDILLKSFANIWQAFEMYVMPIKSAWKEIFPAITVQNLLRITRQFFRLSDALKPSAETMKLIRRTAMGLFAVMDIGWMVLKQVVGLFLRLVGATAPAGNGILGVTANIGDFLVKVRDAIKNGDGLVKVFEWLGDAGENLIETLRNMGKWIGDHVSISSWGEAWTAVGNAVRAAWEWMQPIFAWIGQAMGEVGAAIKAFFNTLDFNVLLGLLNAGLIGGLILLFKNFFGKITEMFKGFGDNFSGGGFIDKIKGAFAPLTDTMQAMQEKLKAEALTKIAIAIALLVASVVALSFVDTDKVAISLGAMTVMFGQLAGMMLLIDKAMAKTPPTKIAALSASMILLASAMLILSTALLIMSSMEWDEVARGLVAMGGGLGILVGGLKLLDKVIYKIGPTAAGLILLGGAVVILAAAMKIFASMSWDDILRAGTVLVISLGALVAASALAKKAVAGVPSMILMSTALLVMSGALKVFASMSWDDILRSMTVMGLAIAAMVGAVAILSTLKMAPVGAATMIAMAAAMTILAGALKIFATMSWEEAIRSLVVLAGGLAILAGAMALMGIPIVLLGAIGITAASAAMMLLAPALALLGTMSWDAIGRGLTMLAASLAILAVGGVLLIPAIPAFLALGAAAALIGVGALAAGVGMTMFAAGFLALAGAAAIGSEGIKMALMTLIRLIPDAMASFAQGIIDFALVIAGGAVEFTAAMTTLLTSLIDAIGNVGPKIINTLWNLILLMGQRLSDGIPRLVTMGMNLIIGLLNGIAKKVPAIAKAGTNLLIALMNAFSNEVPRLADAGAKAIIRLVNGISASIDRNSAAMGRAGGRLAASIVRGMVNGIGAGIGEIVNAARNMASNALEAAKNFLNINSPSRVFRDQVGKQVPAGMAEGIDQGARVVEKAGENMAGKALDATKKAMLNMKDAVAMDPNMSPTIRPVLDLSAIKKDSDLIGGILTPPGLKLDNSVAYASQAQMAGYEAQAAADDVEFERWAASQRGDINFYQTNNSPKALSNAEIYRKTNNQLSVAKKELTTTDA